LVSFLFPHTPGAGIRPLGFARTSARGLNGPMAFGHNILFPQTPGAGIRPLGFARTSARGLNGPMAFGHNILFPQTPGAGMRPLGFARTSARGLNGPMAFGHKYYSLRRRARRLRGAIIENVYTITSFVTSALAGV